MRVAVIGNGQSVHALGRARAVASLGHEVRFFTVGPALATPGLAVHAGPIPRGARAGFAELRRFLAGLRDFAPQLFHLHYAGGRMGSLTLLAGARPLVVTVMGGDVDESQHPGGLGWLDRRATRRVLARADALLVKSEALLARLDAWGDFRDRAHVVRWGVDPDVFRRDEAAAAALRVRLGLAPGDRVVLGPRALTPLYGVHLLVEALPALCAAVPDALLLVTGYGADPAYGERLAARARELGCADRFRVVGAIDHADMPALHSLADVTAMCPEADGLPQSLLESMACGTPVVLGELPAYAEVVGPSAAAQLVPRESGALAAAIAHLLKNPAAARDLAARGSARVAQIGLQPDELRKVDAAYHAAVAHAARRTREGVWEWVARALDGLALARPRS